MVSTVRCKSLPHVIVYALSLRVFDNAAAASLRKCGSKKVVEEYENAGEDFTTPSKGTYLKSTEGFASLYFTLLHVREVEGPKNPLLDCGVMSSRLRRCFVDQALLRFVETSRESLDGALERKPGTVGTHIEKRISCQRCAHDKCSCHHFLCQNRCLLKGIGEASEDQRRRL
jgi:hypothetical protein